ncbi:rRNA N6-adenosine-methyltransferase ZCCHC4-like [Xenia sp. Carnegie-2017]|uniref:rRNA N6-adenosine-methyltransferase ZCCHC4-like n=1 Tax=Xenia sp. Carnegie-2017 TaxID=2897299 RepID=UPI001F0470B4|nr:rRNA N6-adenosine-methyltransferase ZCCHC4-like [Xenia sp. Carnegie-2017]
MILLTIIFSIHRSSFIKTAILFTITCSTIIFFEKDPAMVCFKKFLYNSIPNSLMVILDPPFGGLVQVLPVSLKNFGSLFLNYVKEGDDYHLSCLSTFWIFPYFMESHITKESPFFKMCDFKHNNVWQHCLICGKCVKKGYVHCEICKSCKPPGHDCQRV